ncbi:MAG: DUF2752 domain-containing protein [Polyangiaceae bacterium]
MRHPERALVTLLGSIGIVALLWSGVWSCPTAKLFHVPCPGCGSTRAVRALLTGDFVGVAINPFGVLTAVAFGLFTVRAIYLEYVDGHVRRLDEAWGAWVAKGLVVVALLELALWTLRWFGLFGGPVPV